MEAWQKLIMTALTSCGLVSLSCGSSTPPAQEPTGPAPIAEPMEGEEPVLVTSRFAFYSRLDFNVHDRLLRWATEDEHEGAECIAGLDRGERTRWDRAVEAFSALGEGGDERLALRLRFALVDPGEDFDGRLGHVPAWYWQALRDGAVAYRQCWWREDDRRNREWVWALGPLLPRASGPMATRIAAAHGLSWPEERIPVDVVPRVSSEGANTVVGPHHVLIGSEHPGNSGYAALEILFHEASHTFVSPGSDGSIAAIRSAAERLGVLLHTDLWHAVLFFTAGHAAQGTIRELWNESYEQYLYAQGLLDRAWPELREPLERWWLPYLEEEIPLEEAAEGLVGALAEPPTEG